MSSLVGKNAPSFPVLKDQDGNDFDISSILGKEACVIFFYPQAMTYGKSSQLTVTATHLNHLVHPRLHKGSVCYPRH